MLGEENEEYAAAWSSDWRTKAPGSSGKGGAWDKDGGTMGSVARYGPLASFPYRYMMSSLRTLQMRTSYMLASTVVVNPDMYAYVALELDRTAADAPDAWCFLATFKKKWLSSRNGPGEVANMERWMHQRDQAQDVAGGVVTFADGRVSMTPALPTSNGSWYAHEPYDWIARTAPRGVIGFTLDAGFSGAVGNPLASGWIKVTIFDVYAGTLSVTQDHLAGATIGSGATTGDRTLKTFTFAFASLGVRAAGSASPFDFEVKATTTAGSAQPLCLSFVRVIKTPLESPPPPPLSPGGRYITVHKTVIEMMAAGDVGDYDEAKRADLATKFADLAGVGVESVEVIITPASVRITIKITCESSDQANALVTSISAVLSSAEAASAFTGLTITSAPIIKAVAETILVFDASPPPSAPPLVPRPWYNGFIAVLAWILLFGLIALVRRRYERPKPKKPEAASEAAPEAATGSAPATRSSAPSPSSTRSRKAIAGMTTPPPDPATGLQKV